MAARKMNDFGLFSERYAMSLLSQLCFEKLNFHYRKMARNIFMILLVFPGYLYCIHLNITLDILLFRMQ